MRKRELPCLLLLLFLSGCSLFNDKIDTSSLPSAEAVTVAKEETEFIEVEEEVPTGLAAEFEFPTSEEETVSEETSEMSDEEKEELESVQESLQALYHEVAETEMDAEEIEEYIEELEALYEPYFDAPNNPITEKFIRENSGTVFDGLVNGVENMARLVNDFVSENEYDVLDYEIEIDGYTEGSLVVIGNLRDGSTVQLVCVDTEVIGGKKVPVFRKLYRRS